MFSYTFLLDIGVAQQQEITIWDYISYGGAVSGVLLFMSAVALGAFIYNWRNISLQNQDHKPLLFKVVGILQATQSADRPRPYSEAIAEAQQVCGKADKSIYAKLLLRGLVFFSPRMRSESLRQRDSEMITEVLDKEAQNQLTKLESPLMLLQAIYTTAPMIGLLGTLFGMMDVFANMNQQGGGLNLQMLSGGIYEAMITTIGGLILGLFAYGFYALLVKKLRTIERRLRDTVVRFIIHTQTPTRIDPNDKTF
jgi:biopolymer transport protein ExbB